MSVNGITDTYQTTTYNPTASKKASDKEVTEAKADKAAEAGVIYEKSADTQTVEGVKKYKPNAELVAKLKADAEARTAQFRTLVEQLMGKQGVAIGNADDMWKFLADGKFEVDPETKAQAQKDIAEDGYWGVEQTSDRILDFAKALTGGNPDKIEEMRAAFEKGFKQATKTWGKELPEISQKTYQAVMDKFDAWANESKTTVTEDVQ